MLQMVLKIFSHRQDSNYAGGKATKTSQRNKTKVNKPLFSVLLFIYLFFCRVRKGFIYFFLILFYF